MKTNAFLLTFLCLALAILFWSGCANPISPQGGPRDETPPQVVEDKSTPNLQTNFRPEVIRLTFDEWVKLQDVRQQVIISPPIQGYNVRLKGKSVLVELGEQDTLRSNVTYVVQFGEAIKDLTESNPTEDLRFVFSTGPYIDSLEVQGQVVDAYTNEPVEDALVMLYENLADTVVRTERPFYFGRTNENGQFLISNVREGLFKVFALMDADGNYRFNQVNERIGFIPDPITISADSIPPIQLRLFQEALPLQRLDWDTTVFGQLQITYNQPAADLLEQEAANILSYQQAFAKDTFFVWHRSPSPWELYLSQDTLYRDTFRLRAAQVAQAADQLDTLRLAGANNRAKNHRPGYPFPLRFTRPIVALDTARVQLLRDTLKLPTDFSWSIDTLDPRQLNFIASWQQTLPYEWTFLPGAVEDLWGLRNLDTLRQSLVVDQQKKYGNLKIRFNNLVPGTAYVVRLIGKGDELIRLFVLGDGQPLSYEVKTVAVGEYRLEIIRDTNANGRWDTGHYDDQRLPERVIIRPLENVRANWDVEADVDLGALFE